MSAEKVEALAHRIVGCSGGCTASHCREVHTYNVEPYAALLVRAQEGGAAMRKIMKACEPALLFAALHGVGLCPPEESRTAQADIDAFDALLSDLDSALKGER